MDEQNKNALMLAAAGAGALIAARTVVNRWREFDFRGKTVLITGGSRGLVSCSRGNSFVKERVCASARATGMNSNAPARI